MGNGLCGGISMTREQIEAEVFRMVKEDIEATDDEIRDAIDVTSG